MLKAEAFEYPFKKNVTGQKLRDKQNIIRIFNIFCNFS